jgi:hypothetical protein
MPFSKVEVKNITLNKDKLDYLYEEFLCKAIKSYENKGYKFANVSRYNSGRGNFVKGIIGNLYNADLVVADLTGLNPNVFYELGIRHTLKNGTILLTQDGSSLPSDLKSYIAFEYEYPDASKVDQCFLEFEDKMHKALDDFIGDIDRPDNPVKDFLGVKHIIKDEQRKKEILINIELIKGMQKRYVNCLTGLIYRIFEWERGKETSILLVALGLEPILNRMVNLGEAMELIEFLQNLTSSELVINNNQRTIKHKLCREKDIKIVREIACPFDDKDGYRHHVLDLMSYYDFSGSNVTIAGTDPICKSFDYFIQQWERELAEIDK